MLPFNNSLLNSRRNVFILLTVITAVFAGRVIITRQYKQHFFSEDLRNRVVGARILEKKGNVSPYSYKWRQGDDERYLDITDSPQTPVNRNTITPFLLQLIAPFSEGLFQTISDNWYLLEISSLLLITLIAAFSTKEILQTVWIVITGFIFFGCSTGFRLHNVNGQVYIFFPFLMLLLFLFDPGKQKPWLQALNGLILALFILIRPISIVFILPYLFRRKWIVLYSSFFSLAVYFAILFINNDLWLWKDYSIAMNYWSKDYFDPTVLKEYRNVIAIHEIEGSSIIAKSPIWQLSEDSSVRALASRLLHIKLYAAQLIFIAIALVSLFLLTVYKKLKAGSGRVLFIIAFICYFILETCLPAVRNSYNYVQWLFPLVIIFSSSHKLPVYIYMALVAGGILALGFLKFLPFDLTLAELIFAGISLYFITHTNSANA